MGSEGGAQAEVRLDDVVALGGGAAVRAELLGPDVGAGVAFEVADREGDADLRVAAEQVGAVLGRVQPGDEDLAHAAEVAGAPGEVLARPPAARREVAGALHPVGELAPAGVVAE